MLKFDPGGCRWHDCLAQGLRKDRVGVLIVKLRLDRAARVKLARVADLARHAQESVGRGGPGTQRGCLGQISACEDILEVRRAGGVEIDLALKAGLPPVILVLDEAGVGPLDHDRNQLVRRAETDVSGHVELGRRARVLAHPDRLAVDVDEQRAFAPAEVQHEAAPLPVSRHGELAAVDARGILAGHMRRLIGERHDDVGVVGRAVALHRPVARHRDGRPTAGRQRIPGHRFGPGREFELPLAVQAHEPRRLFAR